jgi:hypothetical protein
MAKPPPEVPEIRDYVALVLHGMEYFVPWARLQVGHSVFLPTTMPSYEVQRHLRYFERRFNMELAAGPWQQEGCLGVRIWRLS